MDRSQAAFEAFDGIEIELAGGRVLRVPAFSLAEAMRYIRKAGRVFRIREELTEDAPPPEVRAFYQEQDSLVRELAGRIDLTAATLDEIGFTYDAPGGSALSWGDLTAEDMLAMCAIVLDAALAADPGDQAVAQLRWLDEAPSTFGLDAEAVTPAETLQWGWKMAEGFYHHLYGLASDFYFRLHQTPMVEAWRILGPSETSTSADGAAT